MQAFISSGAMMRPGNPVLSTSQTRLRKPNVSNKLQRQVPKMILTPEVANATTLYLSQSTAALELGKLIAGPGINLFNFVMIVRIILTWYPQTDLAKVPWIFIAVPTEPLLRATRKVIQPVGGVDISPIVWFAIMSFVHEILVGPQGLLILLSQK